MKTATKSDTPKMVFPFQSDHCLFPVQTKAVLLRSQIKQHRSSQYPARTTGPIQTGRTRSAILCCVLASDTHSSSHSTFLQICQADLSPQTSPHSPTLHSAPRPLSASSECKHSRMVRATPHGHSCVIYGARVCFSSRLPSLHQEHTLLCTYSVPQMPETTCGTHNTSEEDEQVLLNTHYYLAVI